jgi:hypothetical protein
MVPLGLSNRTHLWLRLAALAVIAAAWLLPRTGGASNASAATAEGRETHAVHAPVASR